MPAPIELLKKGRSKIFPQNWIILSISQLKVKRTLV